MDSTNIIVPFDFPFAILEHQNNSDPTYKRVYAVADGQYTYGPLSLFQYLNDEKYAKTIRSEKLPLSLPCKEFYIVESGASIDDAIEINDNKRGPLYVKEVDVDQMEMRDLIHEMIECKNELRNLKSIVSSEERTSRRSSSANVNNRSMNGSYKSAYEEVATPLRNKKQIQSTIVQRSISTVAKRNVNTPPRSQSVITTTRILLKNVKSSGYGQIQSPTPKRSLSTFGTPERSFRK